MGVHVHHIVDRERRPARPRAEHAGAEGWEVVGFASADKTIGLNSLTAILKRELMPLPVPDGDQQRGWLPDPAGRFEIRYWNGDNWTRNVANGKQTTFDAPTLRSGRDADVTPQAG